MSPPFDTNATCSTAESAMTTTFEKGSTVHRLLSMTKAPQAPERDVAILPSCNVSLEKQQEKKRSFFSSVSTMSRVPSSPALVALKKSQPVPEQNHSPVLPRKKKARIRHSISAPNLNKQVLVGALEVSGESETGKGEQRSRLEVNPEDHLKSILSAMGVSADIRPALSLSDFFLPVLQEHVDGYSAVSTAVRDEDLNALAQIREAGSTLQCCNKFGESVVHLACRRRSLGVLNYLIRNGVSVRLVDDWGRTPLHEAFWTPKPEVEIVKVILQECPDLLFVCDKRGFTPLAYARRDHWSLWSSFLDENIELLIPRELLN